MGSEDNDLMEPESGGGGEVPVVTCSICFESVVDNGGRSWAKLQCQHTFHLDCIGSAFNAKGVMQCPNCRKIEKGQWLYANGSRSCSEFSIDDWAHEEDIYDLSFSEVPFGFQWCPYNGLTRLPSSSGERELPSAYHDSLGHHAIFTEQAATASAAHSCPYFTYFQPVQYTSLNSNEGNADNPNTGHHWGGFPGPSDSSISHTFPVADLHYHTWDHPAHSFSFGTGVGGFDHVPVSSAPGSDFDGQPRSASIVHPLILSHGSGPRAGNVVVSPGIPPYLGINYRRHGRPLGRSYRRQQQSNAPSMRLPVFSIPRGSSGPRASAGPLASIAEHRNGYYVFPSAGSSVRNLQQADDSLRGHFYGLERDRFTPLALIPVDRESTWRGAPHQVVDGLDSGNRSSSIWHNHGSERSRTENSSQPQGHPPASMHNFL